MWWEITRVISVLSSSIDVIHPSINEKSVASGFSMVSVPEFSSGASGFAVSSAPAPMVSKSSASVVSAPVSAASSCSSALPQAAVISVGTNSASARNFFDLFILLFLSFQI